MWLIWLAFLSLLTVALGIIIWLLNTLDTYRYRLERMHRGLVAIEGLIDDSRGVAGLHMNGEIAPWDDLRTGGRYESWLVDFDLALGHISEAKNTIVVDFKPKK